jgi:hypothetical protein
VPLVFSILSLLHHCYDPCFCGVGKQFCCKKWHKRAAFNFKLIKNNSGFQTPFEKETHFEKETSFEKETPLKKKHL